MDDINKKAANGDNRKITAEMIAAALMRKGARLARVQAGRLADLVYPPDIYCICCGREIQPGRLYSMCDDCLMKISWANGKLCAACGKPLEDWYPDMYCSECVNKERSFDSGITCFQYKEAERMMIREFKYHGKSYMARKFSEILFDKIVAVGAGCDILVPVPMFKKKKKKRGYDQAALLAEFTAKRLGLPCCSEAIERTRNTAPMNKLDARERRRNLENAFRVTEEGREAVKDRRVMLVDDIYTTGTTTEHCSEILKDAGAVKVTILSLAAGRNQRELPQAPTT